ncbi:MAG: UDP-N-acetylmuramoyl-tripeptide--D-alanyl-D-alanine ligase [Bacillota bacterium]
MKEVSLKQIIKVINGKILRGQLPLLDLTKGVSLDSRQVKPGELFFAFPGERVDGHDFVNQALAAGAIGAVVKHWPREDSGSLTEELTAPLIQVDNVLKALQDLAAWYRSQFSLPVIGITGSTGKTSTKDLIAAVLSKHFCTLKTAGNYNNEIGVPLTLLQLADQHQIAVVEMAMRRRGEIAALCSLAKPTGGVITNIGHTHQELLGSQGNIARAKGELLEYLSESGWAVLNADDPWQPLIASETRAKKIFYGLKQPAEVFASHIQLLGSSGSRFRVHLPGEVRDISLPIPGEHNIYNALAAIGVGWLMGMRLEEMADGLAEARLSAMRLDVRAGDQGTILINDAYNANPDSMRAALRVLANTEGKRTIAIMGDMYELGDYTEEGHRRVGEDAAHLGISLLITVGQLAEGIARGALGAGMSLDQVVTVLDKKEAVNYVREYRKPGDVILVKGSRGMKMEEIVKALQPAGPDGGDNKSV